MDLNAVKLSKSRCLGYRKKILEISQTVTAVHIGGAFSCIEILDYIYYELINNKFPESKFIMSKGHSCLAQYLILNSLKIISDAELKKYCTDKGILGCHPDLGNPGINASTGSLGHGLGLCTGLAHAYKTQSKKGKIIVLISDGELQEGSTWESLMMASNLGLDNLLIFVDHNGSQSFGITKFSHPSFYPIKDKLDSFVCDVIEVNGHDVNQIDLKMKKINKLNKKPKIILANTVKGKGVDFMEDKPIWHYRSPSKEEFKVAIDNLKEISK